MTQVEKNVVYGMYSGLALLMDVHRPANSNGHGVVYINGSGWHAPLAYDASPLNRAGLGMPYIEALQAGGYTVFALNHRAAPRFRYPAAVEDAQRAVRFVRHHASAYGIDPVRIGGAGGSSGGHLVSLLGVLPGKGDPGDPDPVNRESSRLQCVVARAAPVDLTDLVGNSSGATSLADFMGMLPRAETPAAYSLELLTYRDASPVSHAGKDSPPFLLISGTADTVVPIQQAEAMQKALEGNGVTVELLRIEGAGHGPNFPGAVDPPDYLAAMVRWFDRYLCGV
jgi:acetyl esterase/lipase